MSVIEADDMIDAAKASILAYNHKDWQKAKESLHHDAVYDEKATHRRIEGFDDIITAWQGWAKSLSRFQGDVRARAPHWQHRRSRSSVEGHP
jgi:hypothetical protein